MSNSIIRFLGESLFSLLGAMLGAEVNDGLDCVSTCRAKVSNQKVTIVLPCESGCLRKGFAAPISCRQLSPDNCLLLADFGVFWQIQETGSAPCGGEPFGLGNPRKCANRTFNFGLKTVSTLNRKLGEML
jgi:hypothetical protein